MQPREWKDGEEIELPSIEIEGESYLYDFFGQARTRQGWG